MFCVKTLYLFNYFEKQTLLCEKKSTFFSNITHIGQFVLHMFENYIKSIPPLLRRAYLILAITFTLFCVAAVVVYQGLERLLATTEMANKYSNFPVRLEEVISNLSAMEVSLRGYLLTKEDIHLQRFSAGKYRNDSLIVLLKGYNKAGVLTTEDLGHIQSIGLSIVSTQESTLRKYQAGQTVHILHGKFLLDSMRHLVGELRGDAVSDVHSTRSTQTRFIESQPFYLLLIILVVLSVFTITALFILKLLRNLALSEENLKQKVKEAKAYIAELDQYSFTLSHHLQEPLRKIKIFLDRFEVKNKAFFTEGGNLELWQRIKQMAAESQHYLSEFVNYSNLLKGDKSQSKDYISINHLLETIQQDLKIKIEQTQAHIAIDKNMAIVIGEKDYFHLLWFHLLYNALTHVDATRPLKIVISQNIKDPNWLHWSIQDNGLGIDSDHHTKIFEVFQKLGKKQETDGSGMGLALCKRIVENYGGHIKVESQLGEGSVFHVFLPKTVLGN
jgi:signal transduction histidine kinase